MGIQVLTSTEAYVAIGLWCEPGKYFHTDYTYRFTLNLHLSDGNTIELILPGQYKSKEAAMNRVFEDYDVLTRTLDIRGWD